MPNEEPVTTEPAEQDSEVVLKVDGEEELSRETDAREDEPASDEQTPDTDESPADDTLDDADEPDVDKASAVNFADQLERMRQELKEELGKSSKGEEKRIYTKEELRTFRRNIESKRENNDITRAEYVAYLEQIEDLNEERIRADIESNTTRKFSRSRAEENVSQWASANAPDLLDAKSRRSRETTDFAKRELGVEFVDGSWVVPESVGRVLFGLAYGEADPGEVKKAEARGREKALREKAARDRDLKVGDKPPGDKNAGKKAVKDKLTDIEKEVQNRLGLSPNAMKHFKRLHGRTADVEII